MIPTPPMMSWQQMMKRMGDSGGMSRQRRMSSALLTKITWVPANSHNEKGKDLTYQYSQLNKLPVKISMRS
jgi:hypothetical protein